MSITQTDTSVVREITDAEVAHYREHGWVKLDALVPPGLATELRETEPPEVKEMAIWEAAYGLAPQGIEPFRSLAFDKTLARNAARLLNRERYGAPEGRVRLVEDLLACKPPATKGTHYHQDRPGQLDRPGLTFWIALDEVTPEMGAMRFLSGSHREGPLGYVPMGEDMLKLYPKLAELYETSEPFHYEPGDATVHSNLMVHGGPANTTEKRRWSYLAVYAPADAHAWGGWGNHPPIALEDDSAPLV